MEFDNIVAAGELPGSAGQDSTAVEILVTAPPRVGQFEWSVVLCQHEVGGFVHDEVSLPFSFTTKPHSSSLAVWDNPSPVVVGKKFKVKVGGKCAAGCALAGQAIEICDESGAVIAIGKLGDDVWPGTAALYWTSVEMDAPAKEGNFSWRANFSAAESHLPHLPASSGVIFMTVSPPEHSVVVKVVQKDTHAPIQNAHVRLGVYRNPTDKNGVAAFAVPAGEHRLFVWKAGYDAPPRTINVDGAQDVRIEAAVLPVEDPDAYWQG